MKTKFRNTIYKPVFVLFISLLFSAGLFAQSMPAMPKLPSTPAVVKVAPLNENQEVINQGSIKTLKKSLTVNERSQYNLKFSDVDVKVLPAKENQVVVQVNYRISTDNPANEELIHREMEQNILTQSGNQVNISSSFFKNYISHTSMFGKQQHQIVMNDGSKVVLESFDIVDIVIYLPADGDVVLSMKYGKINFEHTIAGNLHAETYDTQLKAKSVRGKTGIDSRYSKLTFESLGTVDFKAYESTLNADAIQNLTMNTRYSKIYVTTLEDVIYKGYEDRITFAKLHQLKADTKYSEIKLDVCPRVSAVLYEGSLELQQGNLVVLDCKYVDMEFGSLNIFKLNNGYENDMSFVEVDSLISVNGKYNEFEITRLNKVLKLDGYEDEISIGLLAKTFSGLSISGKYVDVELATESGISYQLAGNIQYPELNVDKNDYKLVVHDKDSDKMVFDYRFGNDLKELPAIQVVGYEMHIAIDNK
ncbi:MAG: hypothetical protein AB7S69_13830 [Salinivirgaceae bacterium]